MSELENEETQDNIENTSPTAEIEAAVAEADNEMPGLPNIVMTDRPFREYAHQAADAEKPPRPQSSLITIYTDGACEPNPGRGGWAYVRTCNGVRTEAAGTEAHTTNNRMELRAAIEGLKAIKEAGQMIEAYSDSQYLVNGITTWIRAWKQKGWRGVKNSDLWQQLDQLGRKHSVRWHWIRGHSGIPENERCDRLASQQAGIPEGYEPWWAKVNRRIA